MKTHVCTRMSDDDELPNYRGQGRWGNARIAEQLNALARSQVWFLYRLIQDVLRDHPPNTARRDINRKRLRELLEEIWPGNEPLDTGAYLQALEQLQRDGRVYIAGTRRAIRLRRWS